MQKKVLVSVDQSTNSRNAANYAAAIGTRIKDISFDLLHVQPRISDYLLEDARQDPKARSELQQLSEKNKEAAFNLLEQFREQLVKAGIDKNRVGTMTQPREMGIADEIMRVGNGESYDAILVGRRGVSTFKQLFMGSVTSNLLAQGGDVPIWVVDGHVSADKVLIAVDGSNHSLRAVEHAASILSGSTDIKVHLLHAEPRLGDYCEIVFDESQTTALEKGMAEANRRCIDDFVPRAIGKLKDSGIAENRITFNTLSRKFSPGRSIVEEAARSRYGTIVLGKRGAGDSTLMGKVASTVSQRAQDSAVWIVP